MFEAFFNRVDISPFNLGKIELDVRETLKFTFDLFGALWAIEYFDFDSSNVLLY